jgi:Uma2 family endonuclease
MDLLETRRRKFNINEYYRMAEAGILHEDDNVELIEGEIIEKHPAGKRRFTVDEYYRMAEAGILFEDDHVELIEGEVIEMTPIGGRHAACVDRLTKILVQRVGDAAIVRVQGPIRLSDNTEPQPDVALLRLRTDFYAEAHPTPEDVLLIIEVSETSLEYDREMKVPLYARAGIPEVWVVDLAGEKVHTYSRPIDGSYGDTRSAGRSDSIVPQALPSLALNVDNVFI